MLTSCATVLRVSLNVIGWVKLSLISVTEQIFMVPFCFFYVKSFTKRIEEDG